MANRKRSILASAAALGIITLLAACTAPSATPTSSAPAGAGGPISGPVTTIGAPILPNKIGPTPIAMIPADKRTPEQWMEYLGIRLVETRDAGGPAAWTPVDGSLYFMSNESTTWGSTNQRNGVVFFDAKTKQVVGQSKLPDEYSIQFGSHSAGASADGKWLYLPSHKGPGEEFLLVLNAKTLKINKVYQSLGRPHHINNLTLPDGREVIAIVDFGWNWAGSGIWILDPNKDNQVVGGIGRQDLSGAPYIMSREFGDFFYVGVPAPQSKYRDHVEGFLIKVNMKTWKAVDSVPVGDPIWTEISFDGKWAWVTDGGASKVWKVDLQKMKVASEQLTGPGPWGARLSFDETKLYTADKGEGPGLGQQGRTMSVIDVENSIVTNMVPIGLTTDHVILSPDGKELWLTSNADRKIVVYGAETEEKITEFVMPNDGDTHGSTFIRYFKNDKGELTGEVVSSFSGLRGSARQKQLEFLKGPKPVAVQVSRNGFAPASVSVKPGANIKLSFINSNGTSTGPVGVVTEADRMEKFELKPGQRKTVDFKAPSEPGKITVKNPRHPAAKPFTLVIDPNAGQQAAAAGAAAGAATGAVREINIVSRQIKLNIDSLTVKAGERLKFIFNNEDDEKHNLVVIDQGIVSPDVNAGRVGTFELTMPTKPGTYKVVCAYHPATTFTLVVQ